MNYMGLYIETNISIKEVKLPVKILQILKGFKKKGLGSRIII
jgi:hypothetical protein